MTKTSGCICGITLAALASLGGAKTLAAQQDTVPPVPATRPDTVLTDSTRRPADSISTLKTIEIVAKPVKVVPVSTMQALTLPATASVTSEKVEQTVNNVDPEDAVKYLPSVFLRKRNYGDTQATIGTRVWGVGSSARSLVFADGVPLSALIANNNTIGAPRWGLVSPEEITRIDMMYGPFSAAYAGNSMGAVMEITTRQPDSLEASIEQTDALQHFDLYGTDKSFNTLQTNATLGDRFGRFSFWLSGSYQNSHSQPLLYITSPSFPAGTTGGFGEENKLGATANVLGALGLLHTAMTNAKAKIAYDVTPELRAAYTFGFWRNDGDASVDSYLDGSSGATYAGQAGFASGFYNLDAWHTAHSLSLRTHGHGDWDWEAIGSLYRIDRDQQRLPTQPSANGTAFGDTGRVAVLDGSGWSNVDLKGAWHCGGLEARHIVSFGTHYDRYRLFNPTYNTDDWRSGNFGSVATEGDGKTETKALWAQDSWTMTPALKLTFGGRYEWWRGYDGFNVNGSTTVSQPTVSSSKFSPKAVLTWDASSEWQLSASIAKAYRFATAAELYQLVSTGATFTSPDPHLKPDDDLAMQLCLMRNFVSGMAQVMFFQDEVHDAIISQYLPLVPDSPTLYSYLSNVDHVRARGIEVSASQNDALIRGLELSGSATFLDARTLALSGRASATAPEGSAIGKFLPNIPKWRATATASYHVNQGLSFSLAERYSSKMFTTLDNADVHPNTYQGFSAWLVTDVRGAYRLNEHWFASVGIDNLFDRKYFLFHPFPQRTVVASAKYTL